MADPVTQASCAEEGASNVKFHVVEQRHGQWVAACGTGADGTTLMSAQTVPAHSVPAHCRCRKSVCQRRFYGAEQDAAGVAPTAEPQPAAWRTKTSGGDWVYYNERPNWHYANNWEVEPLYTSGVRASDEWLSEAIKLADRYAAGDKHARLTLHIHLAGRTSGVKGPEHG